MKRSMLLMRKILFGVFITTFLFACKREMKTDESTSTPAASEKKPATELLDMSLAEPARKASDAFTKGDIDGYTAEFADNIKFTWSSGDSLRGKQAVKEYYIGRWKLIDSLNFSDHIFLPIQINESQSKNASTGRWLLQWSFAHVKYKNGKKLNFWLHNVNHYNDAGQIDFLGQYIDRHPIMEATKDMMKK